MAQRERDRQNMNQDPMADEAQGQNAGEAAAAEASIEAVSPDERAAALEAEIASLKDQLLRALAESENQRRRSQREREETQRYAAAALARDLLAVADNLRRALDAVPEESRNADTPLGHLASGLDLTERELLKVFEKHQIKKLVPLGEKFDPHRHEAMFEAPDPSAEPGTVVQVLEPGYLLHDRLLRPARVGVAKADPNAAGGSKVGGRVDTQA